MNVPSTTRARLVLAAFTIGLILTLAFIVPMPLWSTQPAAPPPPAGPATNLGWPASLLAIGFAVALALPFRPYVLALRALDGAASTRLVLALTAGLALVGLLIYPAYGSDVFAYVAYARMWVVYGENALLALPAQQPGDWASALTWFPSLPHAYGPVWVVVSGLLAGIRGDSAFGQVLAYKAMALLGYGAACALIWSLAPPARRTWALVAFAWSPLVLFEVLGKVHNDILLAVAVLAGLRFAGANGVVAATLGGLVKASGLAILPALLADQARQRRWRAVAIGLLGALAVFVLAYAPFWRGPETLAPVLLQTSDVVWSPGSLLIGAGLDRSLARFALAAAWLVACVLILQRVPERAGSAALFLLATLLLLTTAFFAHYLVPVLALAAVSRLRWLHVLVCALSIGALAAYATELLSLAMPAGWIGSPGYQVLGSLVLLAPAGALLITARDWWSPSPATPSDPLRQTAGTPVPPR